jgi:hypothetical protein
MSPVLGTPAKLGIFVIPNLREVLVEMPGGSETKNLAIATQDELSTQIFLMDSGNFCSMT